jgi:two-component system nitrogen regulation response regulator GlnG
MQTNVKRPSSLSGSARRHIRAYFAAHDGHLPPVGLYNRVIDEVERVLIKETLRVTKKNQIQAAKVLGINRNTLRKKMEQYQLMVAK